jgi:hypothetical protein
MYRCSVDEPRPVTSPPGNLGHVGWRGTYIHTHPVSRTGATPSRLTDERGRPAPPLMEDDA